MSKKGPILINELVSKITSTEKVGSLHEQNRSEASTKDAQRAYHFISEGYKESQVSGNQQAGNGNPNGNQQAGNGNPNGNQQAGNGNPNGNQQAGNGNPNGNQQAGNGNPNGNQQAGNGNPNGNQQTIKNSKGNRKQESNGNPNGNQNGNQTVIQTVIKNTSLYETQFDKIMRLGDIESRILFAVVDSCVSRGF